jgi:hypothetical protein
MLVVFLGSLLIAGRGILGQINPMVHYSIQIFHNNIVGAVGAILGVIVASIYNKQGVFIYFDPWAFFLCILCALADICAFFSALKAIK